MLVLEPDSTRHAGLQLQQRRCSSTTSRPARRCSAYTRPCAVTLLLCVNGHACDGVLFVGYEDGHVSVVDLLASDGQVLWTHGQGAETVARRMVTAQRLCGRRALQRRGLCVERRNRAARSSFGRHSRSAPVPARSRVCRLRRGALDGTNTNTT